MSISDRFSKNELQINFNQLKGVLVEINNGSDFSNITIEVGHNNKRKVNLVAKNSYFEEFIKDKIIGDKVVVKYYLTSNLKHDRYYTTATILELSKQ
jgi:hypothetical protein